MVRQMKRLAGLLVSFSFVVGATASCSADCKQDKAQYFDPESGLSLTFNPLEEGVGIMHQFTITAANTDIELQGFVYVDGTPLRPQAVVMHNCPDGDVVGEELAKCTIWRGIPYGLYDDGAIGLIPDASHGAVTQLLLPEFATALMSKPIWGELNIENEPFEVFDFQKCGAAG